MKGGRKKVGGGVEKGQSLSFEFGDFGGGKSFFFFWSYVWKFGGYQTNTFVYICAVDPISCAHRGGRGAGEKGHSQAIGDKGRKS